MTTFSGWTSDDDDAVLTDLARAVSRNTPAFAPALPLAPGAGWAAALLAALARSTPAFGGPADGPTHQIGGLST